MRTSAAEKLWVSGIATILVLVLWATYALTANWRARALGGTLNVELPPETKLVTATWKGSDLWYLTRPARKGEAPETSTFQESSALGIMQGRVIFTER